MQQSITLAEKVSLVALAVAIFAMNAFVFGFLAPYV